MACKEATNHINKLIDNKLYERDGVRIVLEGNRCYLGGGFYFTVDDSGKIIDTNIPWEFDKRKVNTKRILLIRDKLTVKEEKEFEGIKLNKERLRGKDKKEIYKYLEAMKK